MCAQCFSDLIPKLYSEFVRVVNRRVVRLKGDSDVLALSWSNAALCWHHTEHTQPTVVLGSCTGHKIYKVVITVSATVLSAAGTAVELMKLWLWS